MWGADANGLARGGTRRDTNVNDMGVERRECIADGNCVAQQLEWIARQLELWSWASAGVAA